MRLPIPRISRMLVPVRKTAYHVISRTALDGFPFGDVEKDRNLGGTSLILTNRHNHLKMALSPLTIQQ